MIKHPIIFKILNKAGLLNYLNLCYSLKQDRYSIKIPIIHQLGYDFLKQPSRESWLNNTISRILRYKQGAFIDIGVNIGQTLVKLKSIKPDLTYIGFEPNPTCVAYVKELIKRNNWHNCQIIPIALSNKSEVIRLFLKSKADVSASIVKNFRNDSFYASSSFCPAFNGDEVISQLQLDSISVLKIDVEGAELEVIEGLEDTIAKYKPYILCEILPVYNLDTSRGVLRKERQTSLEKILGNYGYQTLRIMQDGQLIPIEKIEVHSDITLCDYVFVPNSNLEKFLS